MINAITKTHHDNSLDASHSILSLIKFTTHKSYNKNVIFINQNLSYKSPSNILQIYAIFHELLGKSSQKQTTKLKGNSRHAWVKAHTSADNEGAS